MSEDIYDIIIIALHLRNHVLHKPRRSWMAYGSSNCRALPWWPGHTARSGMFPSRRRSASRAQSKTPGDQRSQGPGRRWGRRTLGKNINKTKNIWLISLRKRRGSGDRALGEQNER